MDSDVSKEKDVGDVPDSDEIRLHKKHNKSVRLLGFWGTFCLLVLVAAAVGTTLIIVFQNFQKKQFNMIYSNTLSHFASDIEFCFENLQNGTQLLNQIYIGGVTNNELNGSNPNITLSNYEKTVLQLTPIIISGSISFSPLVTTITKTGFESYTQQNVYKLNGPASLPSQVNQGILNATSGLPIGDYIYGSSYPNWHFPIWQVAPINSTYIRIMKDLHTETKGSVMQTIDKAISTQTMSISNIFSPTLDSPYIGYTTPYSTNIAPMTNDNNDIFGISSGIVNWVSSCTCE
jgi:hypothetical protein